MKKADPKIDEQYVYYGNFTFQSGYQGADNLMSKQERPTSIGIMNNEMTVGALKYLRTHGIDIPEQVSIATYGNIENIELLYVQPTLVTSRPHMYLTSIQETVVEVFERG